MTDDKIKELFPGAASANAMIAELALLQHSLIRAYLDAIRN